VTGLKEFLFVITLLVGMSLAYIGGLQVGRNQVASGLLVCKLAPGTYGETEWQCELAEE